MTPHRRTTRTDRSDRSGDSGFTLVELLVVMVVIGLLAAIAVPVFLSQRQKASDTAVKADLRSIAAEVRTWGLEKGNHPTARELNTAGIVPRTSPTVLASVVWRSPTDFCLVGTSTAAGPDTSGLGTSVGVSTRIWAVSASRGPVLVTSADRGCLGTPGTSPSTANGYWSSTGYVNNTFSS